MQQQTADQVNSLVGIFSLSVVGTARLQSDTQPIPGDRVFRIELHSLAGKGFRIRESPRIIGAERG